MAKTAVKGKAPSAVASMNPDNMAQAGLMDDFDGMIEKVRLVPWDYNGNIDHHILAVAVTIRPDGEEPFTQHYSAGAELDQFAPSMDGEESVDLDANDPESLEGVFALRVGSKEQLPNNSNWAHFIRALIDAGFDAGQLAADVRFAEGVYGHFNRIPQKKRSGIVVTPPAGGATEKKRNNDILVVTELKDAPKGTGTTSKGAAPAKANPATGSTAKGVAKKAAPVEQEEEEVQETGDRDELDTALVALIQEAVGKAGDDGLLKGKLAPLALKGLPGPLKAKGVKRISDNAFLETLGEADGVMFDADSGTLMAIPE